MTITTVDKLKKDAEDAEAALLADPKPPEEAPKVDDPAADPPVVKKEDEPTDPSKDPGVADPPVEEPKVPELTTKEKELQTIIDGLNLQLKDENNPTAKQQWLTLQGMLEKANKDIRELRAAADAKPPEPKAKPASEVHNEILSKLTQDYGDGFTILVKDLIKEQLTEFMGSEVVPKLKAHGERVDNIETTTGRTAGEIFLSSVTTAVPDWKQINGWSSENIPQDPKWTVLMNSVAPGTGETYDSLLKKHWANHNVSAVTEIFNLHKDKHKPAGDVTPPAKVPDANEHIDPDASAGGGAPPEDPKKVTYTKAVVDEFYNSIGKGKFDGTPEEKNKLDNLYSTAIMEGRVL